MSLDKELIKQLALKQNWREITRILLEEEFPEYEWQKVLEGKDSASEDFLKILGKIYQKYLEKVRSIIKETPLEFIKVDNNNIIYFRNRFGDPHYVIPHFLTKSGKPIKVYLCIDSERVPIIYIPGTLRVKNDDNQQREYYVYTIEENIKLVRIREKARRNMLNRLFFNIWMQMAQQRKEILSYWPLISISSKVHYEPPSDTNVRIGDLKVTFSKSGRLRIELGGDINVGYIRDLSIEIYTNYPKYLSPAIKRIYIKTPLTENTIYPKNSVETYMKSHSIIWALVSQGASISKMYLTNGTIKASARFLNMITSKDSEHTVFYSVDRTYGIPVDYRIVVSDRLYIPKPKGRITITI